jgi:hypothetical protein
MKEQEKKYYNLYAKIKLLLQMRGEIITGETHILNLSDEDDQDEFSTVRFRVYDKTAVFDVVRQYYSSVNDGAGGVVYEFEPCTWDGFESIKPATIEQAREIVMRVLGHRKNWETEDQINEIKKEHTV